MYDPQIPNFYLANLDLAPFLDNFDGPVGPQDCVLSKSCIRPKLITAALFGFLKTTIKWITMLQFVKVRHGLSFEILKLYSCRKHIETGTKRLQLRIDKLDFLKLYVQKLP